MSQRLRLATPDDLVRINEIYNHYVARSTCTYQETAEPIESRVEWFTRHGALHPVIVAEVGGRVVGWGALSPFHPRSAFRFTVENSVYVDPDWQRRGIGRALLEDLVARARAAGHRSIIAAIDSTQEGSVALHATLGFETVGRLSEAGYKFDRWLDVIYMQLKL